MKKIIYHLYSIALIAGAMAVTQGCEPQGFEPGSGSKVTAIAVKEAAYVSAGTPSMQISLKDNETLQLNVAVLPQSAKNKTVAFANKHPELLTVTEAGLLQPKAFGTDTLTVSATDGSGVSTNFVINIIDHMIKATAINVTAEGSNILLKTGGATFNLAACVTLAPADTWNKAVTYASNDETIATVTAEGIVAPVSAGTTTITITTADGSNITRDCNVTVQDLVKREADVPRDGWTVTTQTHNDYGHMWDATTPSGAQVTGKPEHMFDGQTGSYLSLVKPGGSMSGVAPPADSTPPSFIVDMKTPQEFEYIKWGHRSGSYTNDVGSVNTNNYNYLRVYGIKLYGSSNGTDFTLISPAEPAGDDAEIVWIPQKVSYVGGNPSTEDALYTIPVTLSTYRYVKVLLAVQSKNYAVGKFQHPTYPGAGSTSGNSMQVAEFGLGKIVIE